MEHILAEKYEITHEEELFCAIASNIWHNRGRIPRLVRKLSLKRYGKRDNIIRYYLRKYMGVIVGKYTTGYEQFLVHRDAIESIGAFCAIAENVNLTEGNHPLNYITIHQMTYAKDFGFCGNRNRVELMDKRNRRVVIGNDVWIGRDVTLLPSIRIGDGAIIGAGAIVNHDIPDYAIAVGVPAKVIRYRFTEEQRKCLEQIQWWSWPDEKIKRYMDLFVEPDKFFREIVSREKL